MPPPHSLRGRHGRFLTLILATFLLFTACDQAAPAATPTLPVFATYRVENVFELLYPERWEVLVVREGLILFGPTETMQGDLGGPQITVFRQPREALRDDLAGTLDHYLASGPLAAGYETFSAVEERPVAGREGRAVMLRRGAQGDAPPMQGYVASAQADSDAVYIISVTAAQTAWERYWPIYEVAISSFKLFE